MTGKKSVTDQLILSLQNNKSIVRTNIKTEKLELDEIGVGSHG